MNAGLPDNPSVNALTIDPSTPATLYAGTGSGVFDYQRLALGLAFPASTTLCLNGGRFHVTTQWTTRDGSSSSGQAVALTGGRWLFHILRSGQCRGDG